MMSNPVARCWHENNNNCVPKKKLYFIYTIFMFIRFCKYKNTLFVFRWMLRVGHHHICIQHKKKLCMIFMLKNF